jgi:hypothetical protein
MVQVYTRTSSGLSAAGQLSGICFGEVTGKPQNTDHPFYVKVRDFIRTHPLDISNPQTRANIYYALISSKFTNSAAEQYFDRICDDAYSVLKTGELQVLYDKITAYLGSDMPMKKLDRLFRERFLITTTVSIFLQEMSTQLMYTLNSFDNETGKYIFQILLDGASQA